MQLQIVDALGDRGARPRQEARAHAIGDLAEPQIEARRLDLIGREIARRDDPAGFRKLGDHVIGQDAFGPIAMAHAGRTIAS